MDLSDLLILTSLLLTALQYYSICADQEKKLKYKWLSDKPELDFIVGISIQMEPVCTGVLINPYLVITAANPFHFRIPHATIISSYDVKCHIIQSKWEESNSSEVVCIEYQYKSHSYYWDPFGTDSLQMHSPRHDIAILTLKHNLSYVFDEVLGKSIRYPFYTKLSNIKTIYRDREYIIIGHGFMDKVHVKQNIELDIVEYRVEDVYENCDEWIPKSWGFFVCILNIDKFVGINSGAVLMHSGRLLGIGSFSLAKGDESILVFTDMRFYGPGWIKYCKLNPSEYALEPLYNITS